MDFSSYINSKTVAIVGPAAYMKGSKLGTEIDNHDIVVRINRSIETVCKYREDVGQKSNILYSCLIETAANAGKLNLNELKLMGVDFICTPPLSNMSGIAKANKFHYAVNTTTLNKLIKEFNVRIVDYSLNNWLAKKVNSRPNTGFLAIYDILHHEPKHLSIYGFSFYLDGFIPGCKAGIQKEKGVSEKEFANMAFMSKRHNQKNMWQFAKKTLLNNEKVFLDKTLQQILKLDSLDKRLFQEKVR